MQHEAQQYAGAIQPVMGERVLAVFGLPTVQAEHAQRAVLAALSLQHRLQQGLIAGCRRPTLLPPVGMAVYTGPVAVGGLNGAEAAPLAVVGETMTQAMALGRQAAARADDRAAFREAATYFEQALAALGHLPESGVTRELAVDLRLDLVEGALALLGE